MYKTVKIVAKQIINLAGYEVSRLSPYTNPTLQLLKALNHFNIDMVLDVGANVGQFSSELRSHGYKGSIVSFEPLSEAHKILTKNASKDSQWQIHERCAIGDVDGEIEINISANSASSSVLPITELCLSAAENATYVGAEKVRIFPLDTVAPQYLSQSKHCFIKIDTQGFEWQVLDGSKQIFPRISGVLCEMSLDILYKDQHLWLETIKRLESEGLTLWSINPVFIDQRNGRTLQFDATFFRL